MGHINWPNSATFEFQRGLVMVVPGVWNLGSQHAMAGAVRRDDCQLGPGTAQLTHPSFEVLMRHDVCA